MRRFENWWKGLYAPTRGRTHIGRGVKPLPPLRSVLAVALGLLAVNTPAADAARHNLMPAPAELRFGEGRLPLDAKLTVAIARHDDARLRAGLTRALRRWEERTGLTFARTPTTQFVFADATAAATATLVIDCAAAGSALPALGDDESYQLEVTSTRATLRAPAVVGVLRGIETLLQLAQSDATGWFVPASTIHDRPRFPWRGLLIDVCRHWQPMEVIKRNLDGMALAKLNVLHLHLTEDQGFRVESKKYPRLHELGSDGKFFTHEQIREIIAYAAERGIRVMPEFDIPGHATSWLVGHPELGSAPGPYQIERRWGIFDPVLDPTNEKTYELLEGFLGEMAALFPDPYLHIGGDENNGKHWSANARIQAFVREHGLKNNEGLHAHFNRRIRDILTKHGKKMIGWDEILHPDLPKDAIVHSWRGPQGLADASRAGHAVVLSNGYYIDLSHPASQHYLNDPLPANTPLSPEEQKRVLGGEATMWAEWVTPETIDSRIWPRTAAIAERLWSPREVNDVDDMYRRLAIVSRRLEEAGLQHERNRPAMLRRFAGDSASPSELEDLRALAAVAEPVKDYRRGQQQPGTTQATPLTGFADYVTPDSHAARVFTSGVNYFLFAAGGRESEIGAMLARQLDAWRATGRSVSGTLAQESPRVRAIAPFAENLAAASEIGLEALRGLSTSPAAPRDEAWMKTKLDALTQAAKPVAAVELPIMPALRRLVVAAAFEPKRASLTPEQWRAEVEKIAVPAPPAAKPAH